MKICLICASGGHLVEMNQFNECFKPYDTFLVTYKEKFSNFPNNLQKVYFIRNILNSRLSANYFKKIAILAYQMIILTISELKIFLREKPDIIISTGSEIAIPMIYLSKILGKKVIFIESLTRISDLSFTGKIVRIATDVFLVQWEELTKQYEDTLFKGNLLFKSKINKKNSVDDNPPFIFATVGTAPFPRLIKLIDELSDEFNGNIIVQIGNSQIKPKNAEFFDFLNYEDIVKLNENAKIVISHAGIGSILTALEAGTPLIVIPRKKRYEEINDDHQIQIANFLEKEGIAFVADNGEDLKKIIKNQNISPNEIQINQKRDIPIISFMRGILSQEAKRAEDS